MMVRDSRVDNLLPSIICRDFWLHGHMRRHRNTRDVLRLEGGSLWSRLYYSLPDLVKEHNLEQLVQFLGIKIKMNKESRHYRPFVRVSSASIISAMATPSEETHHVATIHQ